jgi:hypothetical protein
MKQLKHLFRHKIIYQENLTILSKEVVNSVTYEQYFGNGYLEYSKQQKINILIPFTGGNI